MTSSIKGFSCEYRWLSNFWPCAVELDFDTYPSTEHAYQAAKTNDLAIRDHIQTLTAGQCKRFSRSIKIRKDWDAVKIQVMDDLLRQKFSQPIFMHLLLDTHDAYIEETNTWGDIFWGVCDNKGENNLGKLIMQIRSELRDLDK